MDDYISNLDPIEKLLFLYFLTNPCTDISGVYEIPLKTIATDTGIEKEMVVKVLKRFQKDKKIFFEDGWIAIKNFAKHQNLKNPQIAKGVELGLKKAPESLKKKMSDESYMSHTGVMDESLHLNSNLNSNLNLKSEVSDDTKTKIIKFTEKDMEMVNLLTSLIQRNTPSWEIRGSPDKWAEDMNKIHRLDGRTYEQIEYMIKWTQNDGFWSQNILSASKLRDKFNDLIPKLKGIKSNSKPNYVL
jgi:hypothetical protein